MESAFDIPVALFLFKRKETSLRVLKRIALVQPQKIYLLSDQGRNSEEKEMVAECRQMVEREITWPCEIIKNYAEENRGIYRNIALGAKWVFEREKRAIFLEDDNLPEKSFFFYCREMLLRYEEEPSILWVCGTNYLGEYCAADNMDYKFTQHMLPCGWASWSSKFLKYYDDDFSFLNQPDGELKLRKTFETRRLYLMYREQWRNEQQRMACGKDPQSWDYQMCVSLRANGLFGVVPMKNQIQNIGVDEYSTHGGSSMKNIMTKRYCGMKSYPLSFPLRGPSIIEKDVIFEKELEKIIVIPFRLRIRSAVSSGIKKLLKINKDDSLQELLKRR